MTVFLKWVANLATLLSPLLALLYLSRWKQNGREYKLFTIYLVAIGIIQVCLYVVTNLTEGGDNLFLFKYYLLFEFLTLSMFYRYLLEKKWITYVMVFMVLFLILQYWIYPELLAVYNPLGIWISHCLLVVYALMHLYKALSMSSPFILVSGGFVVYLMGSAVAFSAGNIYMDVRIPREIVLFLSSINNLLYFGVEILIVFEWWKNYSKRQIPS